MLLRTAWLTQIAEQLFKDNSFLAKAINWDEYVVAGVKTVVIPQSGAGSEVVRNRTVFPAVPAERVDGDISFDMVDYTTTPRRVRKLQQRQYSYDYRGSIISQDMAIASEMAAEDVLYSWRAEIPKFIFKTTGGNVNASANSTATGQRKAATLHDFLIADKIFTDNIIPKAGRQAMITGQMKLDLLEDPAIKGTFIYQQLANYKEGEIMRIAGFDVEVRPTVQIWNADGTVAKLPGAADAATDCEAAAFWHPNFVGRSVGNMDAFYNADRAEHYGDLLSFELQAGGTKRYTNGRGVLSLVQAQAA